jgi:hypothetical protein
LWWSNWDVFVEIFNIVDFVHIGANLRSDITVIEIFWEDLVIFVVAIDSVWDFLL